MHLNFFFIKENVNEIFLHTHEPITLVTLTQNYSTKEDFDLNYPIKEFHFHSLLNLKMSQLPLNSPPYILFVSFKTPLRNPPSFMVVAGFRTDDD